MTPEPTRPPAAALEGARLVRVLVGQGVLSTDEAARIEAESPRAPGERPIETVVRRLPAAEEQVADALAVHSGLKRADAQALAGTPPLAVLALVDPEVACRRLAIPLAIDEEGTLLLAVADPLDAGLLEALGLGRRRVRVSVATVSAIHAAITRAFGGPAARSGREADRPRRRRRPARPRRRTIDATIAFGSWLVAGRPGARDRGRHPRRREAADGTRPCPACGGPLAAGPTFCPYCTARTVLEGRVPPVLPS